MAVSAAGEVVGSVSGGCVEGAVYELANDVIATGEPVLERYGISDDDAFAVGLTCGGIIDIFVEPASRERFAELAEIADAVRHGRAGCRRHRLSRAPAISAPGGSSGQDDTAAGTLGAGDRLDQAVDDDARGMLAQGLTGGPPVRARGRAPPR